MFIRVYKIYALTVKSAARELILFMTFEPVMVWPN